MLLQGQRYLHGVSYRDSDSAYPNEGKEGERRCGLAKGTSTSSPKALGRERGISQVILFRLSESVRMIIGQAQTRMVEVRGNGARALMQAWLVQGKEKTMQVKAFETN